MARMTKEQKAREAKVNKLASLATFDNPVSIMKLTPLANFVGKLLDAGESDECIVNNAKDWIRVNA